MGRMIGILSGLMLFSAVLSAQESGKFTARLNAALAETPAGQDIIAWIYFRDKGPQSHARLAEAADRLTPCAYRRRMRSRRNHRLVDIHDLAVHPPYRQAVAKRVSRLRHQSRWLNAVSVEAPAEALRELARLPFVIRVDRVFRQSRPPRNLPEKPLPNQPILNKSTALDYGNSFLQNSQINVPALHQQGYNGAGVLIAMLDSGFDNMTHEALNHLHIQATRDFINGDSQIIDEAGQAGNDNHGFFTLSVIGGFREGALIGPAYGASFLLAKTEIVEVERRIEEDHWVAAAEWADSLGADIINTSLGYREFDPDEPSYSAEDMDGNTTVITRAADRAASRGILVVTSAGNEGPASAGINTLGAPADGDSVLAVGAVNSQGQRASFSSMGPTADGRIKPDVMALGVAVVVASSFDPTRYLQLPGTSFSAPLATGVAALLLEARPNSSVTELLEALRQTADNAQVPDNARGWGLIDGLRAWQYLESGGISPPISNRLEIVKNFPNPFNRSTTIQYNLPVSGEVTLALYNIRGQRIATLVDRYQSAGLRSFSLSSGNLASGLYFVVVSAGGKRAAHKLVLAR